MVNDEICIPGYPSLLIFFPAVFLELKFTQLFPTWWNIIICPYTVFLLSILSLLFVTVLFKLCTYSTYLSVVSKQKVTDTSRHTHTHTHTYRHTHIGRTEAPPFRISTDEIWAKKEWWLDLHWSGGKKHDSKWITMWHCNCWMYTLATVC